MKCPSVVLACLMRQIKRQARTWDLERKLLARANMEIPLWLLGGVREGGDTDHALSTLSSSRGVPEVTTTKRSPSKHFQILNDSGCGAVAVPGDIWKKQD